MAEEKTMEELLAEVKQLSEERDRIQRESAKTIADLTKAKDKANSEAAERKRELQSKLSDEEKAKAEHEEAVAAMKTELEELKKASTVAQYKANLLGLGYGEDIADETAKAWVDGDFTKVFANAKTAHETIKMQAIADSMKGNKTSIGEPPSTKDVEAAQLASIRAAMGLPD